MTHPLLSARKNLEDIAVHVACTLLITILLYAKTDSLLYAGIFLLGGFILDVDHLVDYFFYFKNGFNLGKFLNSSYLASGKVYLFMHSWELNGIVLLLSLISGSTKLLVFSLSIVMHLAIDTIQRENPLFYFLFYRLRKGFDVTRLLPKLEGQKR